jgi:hypothetical protein
VTERDVMALAPDVLRHRIDVSHATVEAGASVDVPIEKLRASSQP